MRVSKFAQIENTPQFIIDKIKPIRGYVYFLESQFGFKVGYTAKLKKRMNTFNVKLPFDVELHSVIKTEEFKALEKTIHNLLSERRVNGEWFDIRGDDFENLDKVLENMNLKRELYKGGENG